MKFELLHPKDQLVMMMDRIYRYGLTTTSGGNISILDGDGDIWITPGGIDKGSLTREDIVCVKPDGSVLSKHKPSVELPFHKLVYETRPDVRCVLHAHPPALVSYSLLRKAPDTRIIANAEIVCGKVGIAGYEIPGSMKLGKNIAKEFKAGRNVVMMDNHGVVVCGNDIFEAFKRFETLEYCAKLDIKSNILGKAVPLTEDQIDIARNRRLADLSEFIPSEHGSAEREARREMADFVKRSYRQHLFTSTQGTISVRLGPDSFLITPHNVDRCYLEPEDIVRIDHGWREAGKIPSKSVLVHKSILENHPGINSVIIAHPTNVMAFGITRSEIDSRTIPESYINMRRVQTLPFGTLHRQPEKASELASLSSPVVVVENDAVLVVGSSLLKAFDTLEVADFTADTLMQSRLIGKAVPISDKEVEDIEKAFHLK